MTHKPGVNTDHGFLPAADGMLTDCTVSSAGQGGGRAARFVTHARSGRGEKKGDMVSSCHGVRKSPEAGAVGDLS